jgi:ATPase subunit of ABC transporter with duplicated ATPase domains
MRIDAPCPNPESTVLSIANLTMQFGARPLFENVSVKFGAGNRYGLIGANGSGKSTLMKILGGDLAPSAGSVSVDRHARVGKLRQDQFGFERHTVLDTVIMGHAELWAIRCEREHIYALPQMSEEEGMRVAELEAAFAELDGYSVEARAGELLLGVDIPEAQHAGPMSAAGHPVAGRAHEQPGYQHHSLARGRTRDLRQHHGDHLPRSPLPE